MRVEARCFAVLRELAADRTALDLEDGASVEDAWGVLADRYPGLGPHRAWVRPARNGAYAAWDARLAADDVVAFLPPVSGGGVARLTDRAIDVEALGALVLGPDRGALVTFVGTARNRSDDGRAVTELEYDAYPEMADAVLAQIVDEAQRRWHAHVAVEHRVGVVPLGQAAVAIAVATAHRADAYEASRYVIEAIKQRLPVWKRERFADGSEWKRAGA